MDEPLYERDGALFVPTAHTRGPWSADAQHGGPPAALLARALEALPAEAPMMVARYTLEILRPVPLRPLRVTATVDRPGRRVQLVSVTLHAGDDELCRARAWRIRVNSVAPDAAEQHPPQTSSEPESAAAHDPESQEPAFHRTGAELRFARGSFWELGPSTVWIRLRRPVVDGEAPSPLMRVVAAADFGNGVSAVLPWSDFLFVNTDLGVYLHREAAGEWICLDAGTTIGVTGVGIAESALTDRDGPIGRSLQTLLVERRTDMR